MVKYIDYIEIIARAIIIHQDKILLCCPSDKSSDFYYLPGGHVEKGESIEQSLQRELKEELNVRINKIHFLDLSENFFTDQGGDHHEINFLFNAVLDTDDPPSVKSRESHITFTWHEIANLPSINLLPKNIHQFIINKFVK